MLNSTYDLNAAVSYYTKDDSTLTYLTFDEACEQIKEILTDKKERYKFSVLADISDILKQCALGDEQSRVQLVEEIVRLINILKIKVDGMDTSLLARKIYNRNWGLDIIQDILDDPETEEVYFNDYNEGYRFKLGADKEPLAVSFNDREHMMTIIERATKTNKDGPASYSRPNISCDMQNMRVKVTIPPIASTPTFNIRKLQTVPVNTDFFVKNRTLTADVALLLKLLVRAFANIIIIGPTNSGKSLTSKYLISMADPGDRIAVAETRKEFNLKRFLPGWDIVEYQAIERLGYTMEQVFEAILQSSPDRIIVPEALGSEIRFVIESTHRGHEGLIATLHERRPYRTLNTIAKLLPLEQQSISEKEAELADKIDIVILQKAYRIEKIRRIGSVTEVFYDDATGRVVYNDLAKYNDRLGVYEYGTFKSSKLLSKINDCIFQKMIQDDLSPLVKIGVLKC